jgi:acyl dehydratase
VATKAETAVEKMQAALGQDEGVGEWFDVTQELVNQFADVTHDHQFIHVDPERAKAGPFGGTIAHGFLTLSLLTKLIQSIPSAGDPSWFEGVVAGVNYGFDKVRFVSPVRVGSRIRAKASTGDVLLKDPNTIQTKRLVTVEVDGESRPAMVAEWLTLTVYA